MTELNDSQREEVLNAIRSGQKINAIKIYRDLTGSGLKEAKEFIELLTAQLLKDDPDAIKSSSSGCGTAVVLFAAVVGGSLWWQFA